MSPLYNIIDMVRTQQRRLQSLPKEVKEILIKKGVYDTNDTIIKMLRELV